MGIMSMSVGWGGGEGEKLEGTLRARNFLILVRGRKVCRDVGRVLDAKEQRES